MGIETKESRKLTEVEAGRYIGVASARTLQDWRFRGVGPKYYKLGKRVIYDSADLDLFLAANMVDPGKSP
jgi:hypothetical protein